MRHVLVLCAVIVVLVGSVAGAWWYVNQNPEWWFWAQTELSKAVEDLGLVPEPEPEGVLASGFIEAEEAWVSTEVGGRIVALHANEGDEVQKGQLVVVLDDSLLLAQIEIAEADTALAEANLAQVKASVPQETLDHALAMLGQAKAAQQAAQIAWEDAEAMLENPQELELALTAARAQVAVLSLQEEQARALANSAQVRRDLADEIARILEEMKPRDVWIPVDGTYLPYKPKIPADAKAEARQEQARAAYQSWEAWAGLSQAQAALDGALQYLAQLTRQRANPLELEAQAEAARSQVEIATSAVALAQAQVDGLKIGATAEQIAAVEAQVEIARAALEALQVQADKLRLEAPISGLVLERPAHVGEVALPGVPLITLGDLDNLTLTVYVPEDQVGRVRLGQPVSVTVDAYPGRTFEGVVTYVASEAEFTPKNVQTREQRVNMVFAVKVSLPNPDYALKPGMPADAVLPDTWNEM